MDYISRALVADALGQWRAHVSSRSGVSPLRDLTATQSAIIELEHAHPSGLAQLFAGRATLLSTLVQDREEYAAASLRGRLILDEAVSVATTTGMWTAALVVGTVTFEGRELPLLLRPLSLDAARHDDLVITLRHEAFLNPVFASILRDRGGPSDLASRAVHTLEGKEFDPRPLWAEVRDQAHLFESLDVREALLIGAFDDPEQRLLDDLDDLDPVIGISDVVAAIAGDEDAQASLAEPLPRWATVERDPFAERGMGDLDDSAFVVLDMVALGRSVAVDAPPGSDATAVVAAIAADAAASGRTAIVVGGSDAMLGAVDSELASGGAGDIALSGVVPAWNAESRSRLLSSLTLDTPEVDESHLRVLGEELLQARSEAASRYEALHRPHRPWGVSAFETVQAVVRLTGQEPQPATAVRLGTDAAAAVAEHGLGQVAAAITERLHGEAQWPDESDPDDDAADRFAPWWYRIATSNEHGAQLDEALATLVHVVPRLRADAQAATRDAGVDEAPNLAVWREQVKLFCDVQVTLDTFSPAVYHRSLADLVAATAPSDAVVEDMSGRERRSRVRRAGELLRPGRSTDQLHVRLKAAAQEAETWRDHCSSGGWPVVPDGYLDFAARLARVEDAWAVLAPVLPSAAGLDDPERAEWEELAAALTDLADGVPGGIDRTPARPATMDLAVPGFAPLLADLESRHASPEQIRVDLEFSWWAAAFDGIVGADPRLIEAGALGAVVERYLSLDSQFAQHRVEPLMRAVAEHRRQAIARHPSDARDLFATLMEGSQVSVRDVRRDFGPVVAALRPVVIARAEQVSHLLPPTRCVDLAIVYGAESLATAQLIPALARATQVVVVADARSATRSAVAELAQLLPRVALRALPQARDPRVTSVLTSLGYEKAVAAIPAPGEPGDHSGLEVTVVDAVAQPVAGRSTVESTRAEVIAVVETVMRASATVPRRSVAVVAGNDLHAARIADALAERDDAVAARIPVVVCGEAAGLAADEIVLSIGYARDHRGVLPADMGILTSEQSAPAVAQALVAAGSRLTVLTALAAHHLSHVASAHEDAGGVAALAELVDAAHKPVVPPERAAPGPSDWLLADVARLLRADGLAVRLRYGPGGQAIPLVVGDARDRGYSVAVVTDELPSGPRGSVRDQLRWQYRHLEALGWKVVTLWTIDVFMDPTSAAAQIKRALRGDDEITGEITDEMTDAITDENTVEIAEEIDDGAAADQEDDVTAEDAAETVPEDASESEPEPEAETQEPPEPRAETASEPEPVVVPPRKGTDRPLIPTRAWEDEDAAWGDRGSSRDDEIKRDRPPHW